MTVQEKFNVAMQLHGGGQLPQAQDLYRQILTEQPTHHQAMHLLGMSACQTQQYAYALDMIQKAIFLQPSAAEYHLSLGVALDSLNRPEEAIAAFSMALSLRPDYPQAHNNMGNSYATKGEWGRAMAYYQIALTRKPDYADARYNLANALSKLGRSDESRAEFRRVLEYRPGFDKAWEGLGNAALALGRAGEAVDAYRRAITLRPDYAPLYFSLGIALYQLSQVEEAMAAYRKAVELSPDFSQAQTNLGVCLKMTGRLDAALASYEKALESHPANVVAHDAMLYLLHFHPDYGPMQILERHRKYDEQYARLGAEAPAFSNDRRPERKLRIGYVSPNLCDHVVGWNLLPLLKEHDREQFEIFCYAHVAAPDDVSRQLGEHCDVWRDIHRTNDELTAKMIRLDEIDILVDLSLHMMQNRLLVFARRAAPVQVSYLGYCSTTGLSAMQYRLSDPHLDPEDSDLSCYTEQTVRLPRSYWCYHPCGPAPEPGPAPAAANGYVTFGCLNNFSKVSLAAQELWAKVLGRVAGSKLLLQCMEGSHRCEVAERFARHGIAADRLEFIGHQRWPQYIETYQRIDVALDPLPYGGGITTCDALWMGVPVITLSGRTAVGRGGRSILTNVGLSDLIAFTPEEYVDKAAEANRWIELRPTLRRRVKDSPLMDAKRFARDVEAAYRQMWTQWTKQP